MANENTSKSVASKASKLLSNPNTPKAVKERRGIGPDAASDASRSLDISQYLRYYVCEGETR